MLEICGTSVAVAALSDASYCDNSRNIVAFEEPHSAHAAGGDLCVCVSKDFPHKNDFSGEALSLSQGLKPRCSGNDDADLVLEMTAISLYLAFTFP